MEKTRLLQDAKQVVLQEGQSAEDCIHGNVDKGIKSYLRLINTIVKTLTKESMIEMPDILVVGRVQVQARKRLLLNACVLGSNLYHTC